MRVRVNDVELDLPAGTSALDAVFAAGDDVPYFCSQEYLSPVGACRMCLARVGAPRKDKDGNWVLDEGTGEPKVFWSPNLVATCTTQVSEGMVIDTRSEPVKLAQNRMVEHTLLNHPLDCPVCDKGGACELQDRAYEYGSGLSRFEFDKRHQEKHHALSALVTLDRERCIHCKRCVRFFEEVPGDSVLDFIERGSRTYIGTAEEGLPSGFSGNVTDVCPVGALLDATSRFRGRNWEYHHTPSVTMDDATGAALTIDTRTGRIERIKGRLNPEVNKAWLGDGTRFGHEYADHPSRLMTPLVRRGGELVPATWEEAAAYVAERLEGIGGADVGVALRADATLEEGVAALALAEALGTGSVDHAPRPAASLLPPRGLAATIADVATADALLVVGDVTEEAPVLDLRVKDALKGVTPPALLPHGVPIADLRLKERAPWRRELLAVAAPYRVDLMRFAGTVLLYAPGQEAALFRALVGEPSEPAGVEAEAVRTVSERLRAAERPVVVLGGLALASREAADAAIDLARTVGARLLVVGPMANSRGLEQLGVTPRSGGRPYPAMLDAARAVVVSHLDPAQDPDVAERLRSKELVVVHDSFLTATAAVADVVLPAKTVYERDGTVVNLEGRFLRVNAAPVEGGESEDLTGVVKRLGEALGRRLDGRSLRSAHRLLAQRFGLDLTTLPEWGAFLEPKGPAASQAARTEGRRRGGNVVLAPSQVRPEYAHLNPRLLAERGGPPLRVNPADAAALGLGDGDDVRLRVDGVWRRAQVRVTEAARPGLMTLPATPDQPQGLAHADLSTLQVVRGREAVAL